MVMATTRSPIRCSAPPPPAAAAATITTTLTESPPPPPPIGGKAWNNFLDNNTNDALNMPSSSSSNNNMMGQQPVATNDNENEWPRLGQEKKRNSSTKTTTTTATTATTPSISSLSPVTTIASSLSFSSSSSSNNQNNQNNQNQQNQQNTSTTSKVNNNNKKNITDTSILAPSFVPARFRDLLLMPASQYLPIIKPQQEPILSICQRIFFSLVAPIPTCFCSSNNNNNRNNNGGGAAATAAANTANVVNTKNNNNNQQQQPDQQHALPWTMVPRMVPMEPNYIYSYSAQIRKASNFKKVFPPSVYDVTARGGGRDAYLHFFESLIREEFEETMILYERYTQHYQLVKPMVHQQERPAYNNSNQEQQQHHQEQNQKSILQEIDEPLFRKLQLPMQQHVALQQPQTIHRASISIGGIADARPALQMGDHVLLRCPVSKTHAGEIQTTVESVVRANHTTRLKDQIIVAWQDNVMRHSPDKVNFRSYSFSIRFLPSITRSQRCLTALKWLKTLKPWIAKNLLFPTSLEISTTTTTNNNNIGGDDDDINNLLLVVDATDPNNVLNEQQSRFCKLVQRRTQNPSYDNVRPPIILTGPAGTGKTKALLMSILTTLSNHPQHRVLVCTPSHTAADVITRCLMKHLPTDEIFRLCDPTRPVSTAPVDILPLMRQSTNGDFTLPATPQEFINLRVIVCTCTDAHILFLCGMSNASLRSRRQCLQSFINQAVRDSPGVSIPQRNTTNDGNVKTSSTLDGVDLPHFTHLFIDEAAQATEPETLIPFSVVVDDEPNIQKVEIALTGDPRQLHPEVYSPWARPNLQLSLLERLLQQGDKIHGRQNHMLGPVTKDSWVTMDELLQYSLQKTTPQKSSEDNLTCFLTLSYRGHPSFLLVPSKLFYYNKLRSVHDMITADNDKWNTILRSIESLSQPAFTHNSKALDWPIHFRGVIGKDTSVSVCESWGGNSWSNPAEAKVIVDIVCYMVQQLKVPTLYIGVMAAFRAQVVVIRQMLRGQGLGAVNVGTVEDYQSVERQIILLSLTRSNPRFIPSDLKSNIGLYQQPKRMNVALTRASNMLIVVGNPNTMAQDPYWNEWLQFCSRNGLYYHSSSTDATANNNQPKLENGSNSTKEMINNVDTAHQTA